jgi:putative flippase GtrA
VLLAGLAINALGVAIAVDVAELPRLAGELTALPPATVTTFVLARSWVFGAGDRRVRGAAAPRLR